MSVVALNTRLDHARRKHERIYLGHVFQSVSQI